MVTVVGVGPLCRSTLVSASCNTRYADASSSRGTARAFADHLEPDREAGRTDLGHQLAGPGQRRLRRRRAGAAAVPQDADQPAHLLHRLPAEPFQAVHHLAVRRIIQLPAQPAESAG